MEKERLRMLGRIFEEDDLLCKYLCLSLALSSTIPLSYSRSYLLSLADRSCVTALLARGTLLIVRSHALTETE